LFDVVVVVVVVVVLVVVVLLSFLACEMRIQMTTNQRVPLLSAVVAVLYIPVLVQYFSLL
jgi:hypothetical protein